MNRAEYEELLSAALDQPADAAMQARLAAALEADPALCDLARDWGRIDQALRATPAALAAVDWAGWAAAVRRAVAAAEHEPEQKLERALRRLPVVDARVDWPRLSARISASCRTQTMTPAQRRFRRPVFFLAGLLGSAALLGLAVWLPGISASAPNVLQVSIRKIDADEPRIAEARFASVADATPHESAHPPVAQVLYLQLDRQLARVPSTDRGYY